MEEIFDDPLENELLDGSDNENNETETRDDTTQEPENSAKKRQVRKIVIRKPQAKLDPDRLCGKRGIPILPELLGKVQFEGKNHEKEDLDLLMSKLEHWSHRLFPKFSFDNVLERVEKLGSKKPVQVCIRKMRLDLPIFNDEVLGRDSEEERDDNEQSSLNDPFDNLLRETTPSNLNQSIEVSNNIPITTPNVISEETRQRIERNRQLAMEKRKRAQERTLIENSTTDVENHSTQPVNYVDIIQNPTSIVEDHTTQPVNNVDTSKNPSTISDDSNDMEVLDEDEFLAQLDM